MNDTERKALEVAKKHEANETRALMSCGTYYDAEAVVMRLSAAGLLVTPLHERALEACKQHYRDFPTTWNPHSSCGACSSLGRKALEAEKPKQRWIAESDYGSPNWIVRDTVHGLGGWHAKFGGRDGKAEADARAYADQKNREDAR